MPSRLGIIHPRPAVRVTGLTNNRSAGSGQNGPVVRPTWGTLGCRALLGASLKADGVLLECLVERIIRIAFPKGRKTSIGLGLFSLRA